MNPFMFEQAKKNMNPQTMKMASDMISKMSDEDLKRFASMSGMGNVSPDLLRNSAGMMSNMSDNDFERMKNMAPPPGGIPNPATYASSSTPTTSSSAPRTPTASTSESATANIVFPKIENLKTKGNDQFKKGDYEKASSMYFEAIMECEEERTKNNKNKKADLDKLEVACRLNYANAKAKLNDFEIVMLQAKEVLKLEENGKAYFRLGQAMYKMGKPEAGLINLEKAVQILKEDNTVKELYNEVKAKVDEVNKKKKEEEMRKAEMEKKAAPPSEEPKREAPGEEFNDVETTTTTTTTTREAGEKPKKMKKKTNEAEPDFVPPPKVEQTAREPEISSSKPSQPISSNNTNYTYKNEDVIIQEDAPARPAPQTQTQPTSSAPSNAPFRVPEDQFSRSKEELKKMSPDQLRMMCDTLKSMDNAFLKNMLKAQSGVEMSDDQVNMFKTMVTPEMLQMMGTQDFSNLGQFRGSSPFGAPAPAAQSNPPPSQSTSDSTTTQASSISPNTDDSTAGAPPPGMMPPDATPNFASLMQNSEFLNNLLDNLKKNPETLRGMVSMMGENHPVAKLVQKSTTQQLSRYITLVQWLLKFVKGGYRVVSYVRENKAVVGIFALAVIVYLYYRQDFFVRDCELIDLQRVVFSLLQYNL
eukprot:TRINITY_DN12267_c0_g2_i2.p1 TRINITY_DN12267_c0_g2~~TRINITY_DN12267_c0_g2_i2.p1  ORF type:complete len:643 (-),score=139.41 TRINITY_DN12267_c0_g2_i2:945-2873(-)